MAFHIQKPSSIEPSKIVYFVKDFYWSDDYSERKTWSASTTPSGMIVNPDGKNGGWEGATIVEE